MTVSSRDRRIAKMSYQESVASASGEDLHDLIPPKGKNKQAVPDDGEDEGELDGCYALRRTRSRSKLNGLIVSDEEDGDAKMGPFPMRNRTRGGANGLTWVVERDVRTDVRKRDPCLRAQRAIACPHAHPA